MAYTDEDLEEIIRQRMLNKAGTPLLDSPQVDTSFLDQTMGVNPMNYQQPEYPMEFLGGLARGAESVTDAPRRAAMAAGMQGENPLSAFASKFAENPDDAPTQSDLNEIAKLRLQRDYPQMAAIGFGDVAGVPDFDVPALKPMAVVGELKKLNFKNFPKVTKRPDSQLLALQKNNKTTKDRLHRIMGYYDKDNFNPSGEMPLDRQGVFGLLSQSKSKNPIGAIVSNKDNKQFKAAFAHEGLHASLRDLMIKYDLPKYKIDDLVLDAVNVSTDNKVLKNVINDVVDTYYGSSQNKPEEYLTVLADLANSSRPFTKKQEKVLIKQFGNINNARKEIKNAYNNAVDYISNIDQRYFNKKSGPLDYRTKYLTK